MERDKGNAQNRDSGDEHEILERVRGYLGVLRKRKWTVILVNALVVALAMAYTSRQTPVYRATATLIIDRSPPQLLSSVKEVIELGSSNYWAIKDYLRTQYEIIRSREVAERVVDRLNLRGDRRLASAGEAPPAGGAGARGGDPVGLVRAKIRVEPLPDSLMVYIHADDPRADFAMELSNAFAHAYRAHNLQSKKKIILEAQKDLDRLVERLRLEKEEAETRVSRFELEHNIGSLENQQRVIDQRITDFTRKLNAIGIRRIELESRRAQLGRYSDGSSVFTVAYASVLDNPLIVSMKKRHVELLDLLTELRVTYLNKHPKVVAVRRQLRRIEREIKREVGNLLQAVEDEYNEVLATEIALLQKLEEAKGAEREMSRIRAAYLPLVQRRDEAVKFYEDVVSRQTETTLTAQSTMNNVRIHDLAVKPTRPVRPNWRLAAAVALLLGLMGGIGFAFLREFLDNTVKDREDIEEAVGLGFLGVMPTMTTDPRKFRRYGGYGYGYSSDAPGDAEEDRTKIEHPALLVHYRMRSFVAERARNIRTNLLFMMPERPLRALLVTSPNPEEGKTTVSVNIAIVMAQGGARTLLIDGDLRRPRVHSCFGFENERGLSNAVIEAGPIESYTLPSEVPNLDLLLSGPVPPDPTALLHTERFSEIMRSLLEQYDAVVFDSPPLLPVTDARIIATHVDGVVLVAKSHVSARDGLALAKQELQRVNANILGCVLNDHDIARKGYGHYKYYRKRYYPYAGTSDARTRAS